MRVTTLISWDLVGFWESGTWEILEHDFHHESGTVDLCKGDDTAKAAEQQQQAFQQQLMQVFTAQYGKQSAQLDYLNSILKPMAENPRGYDPATLTAMRTSASDAIAQNSAQAKQAVQADMAAKGGGTGLPAGVDAQISEQLANSAATQQSQAQRDITVQDANLKQVNFWNAIQGLSGGAQMLNPTSYASSANQAGSTVAGLSEAVTSSQQSGWLNAALGGLGGAAGGFLGGPAFASMTKPCWIARVVYGEADPRWVRVRAILFRRAETSSKYRFWLGMYIALGEPASHVVARSRTLQGVFRRIFDGVLADA